MIDKNKEHSKSSEEILRELKVLNEKCFKDDPEEEDLKSLREYLNQNPHVYSYVFDVAKTVEEKIIGEISPEPALAIYIQASTSQMRMEMGYENAPILEQILIDNIINCWLRLQFVELSPPQHRTYKHDIREDRLTAAQNRLRQACVTYIRVKKMISQTPALQINIATEKGQQVNIAGDVEKSSNKKRA